MKVSMSPKWLGHPVPTDSATLIEEGLRRIQYFMKKNLTGDYYT